MYRSSESWFASKLVQYDKEQIEEAAMNAVKKMVEVDKDKSIRLTSLPFKVGSKVEVIVMPAEKEDIFSAMDAVVKKKKLAPKSLKEIEKIVHEVRGVK